MHRTTTDRVSHPVHAAARTQPNGVGQAQVVPARPQPSVRFERRRHGHLLEDLLRAGLSLEDAHAQIARLDAGDIWGG